MFSGGTRSIMPQLPTVLMGFGNIPAEAIDDAIEINGLILKHKSSIIIFLTVDVLFIGQKLKDSVLENLREKKVLNKAFLDEDLIWMASHNHHAPACDPNKPGLGRFNQHFFDQLCNAAVQIISECLSSDFIEGYIEYGDAQAKGLIINRRKRVWDGNPFKRGMRLYPNPGGPKDETVHMITCRAINGEVIALIWNFGCHTLTHYSRSRISSDYPGVVRSRIRQEIGNKKLPVLFTQGFSGNILPLKLNTSWFRRNPADILNRIFYGPSFGPFTQEKQSLWMNTLADVVVELLKKEGVVCSPVLERRTTSFPLAQIINNSPSERKVKITQLILSKKISILFVSAEMMTEYRSILNSAFPNINIIPVSCVDDSFGYLPLDSHVKEGGYETKRFFTAFGLEGASFREGIEQCVIENAKSLSITLDEALPPPYLKKYNMKISRKSIAEDIKCLGIESGDTVFFKADIFELLLQDAGVKNLIIHGFRDAVGPNGTISSAAYTQTYSLASLKEGQVFNERTPSTAGALANIMLKHPDHVRSHHPSASIVAIGGKANEVCANHHADAPPFLPFKTLSDLDGWLILFGCVNKNPGFGSVHWIQHELGLATQWRKKNTQGIYYMKNGKRKLFLAQETGGCSRGFNKFYADYIEAGKLRTGKVGGQYAIAIRVRDAFDIERNRLKSDPTYSLCSEPTCAKCRTAWDYNKMDIPKYYFYKILEKYWKPIFKKK